MVSAANTQHTPAPEKCESMRAQVAPLSIPFVVFYWATFSWEMSVPNVHVHISTHPPHIRVHYNTIISACHHSHAL